MAEAPPTKVPVLDLRGAGSPAPGAVLADPSGRRARLLGRAGRLVGLVFVAWFVCLVLAGLGLLPGRGIPLGSSVAPSQPQHLARIPPPRQPTPADLRPAAALRATPVTTRRSGAAAGGGSARAPATSKGTPGAKKAKPVPAVPVAPSVTTPAAASPVAASPTGSATAPGHSTTSGATPGHSGAAPGTTTHSHTSTTTTTTAAPPGKSGSAPGQTRTDTTGHGPPG